MWFSEARKRPAQNHGGPMWGHLGLVLHVQEGNGDLAAQFNNPASESSYTWAVSKDGGIDQFVDSDLRALGAREGERDLQLRRYAGIRDGAVEGSRLPRHRGALSVGKQTIRLAVPIG
jgi:hypothetical protein